MLKLEIPENKDKIKRQIEALKYRLTQDTREEDKIIHQQAIRDLEKALRQYK